MLRDLCHSYQKLQSEYAFANPSNPQFDKEATADAYGHALAFFKALLK
jgi:carboxymethylenebutenolidase